LWGFKYNPADRAAIPRKQVVERFFLIIWIFRDAKGFPNDASHAIHTQAADIDPQTSSAQVVFADLPDGVYAVSVFHDENMNEKLDKNFVGVPKEGYGASNNPKKRMGPPTFDETKFQLSGTEQSVEIKLMYWSVCRE
jgi:uncharacterized protein (DUF2141 family)